MRTLISFTLVSLDGCDEGPDHELDWGNLSDDFDELSVSQLHDIGTLLFGRVTYEGMVRYWTTPAAAAAQPEVAELMHRRPKVVFSSTPGDPGWQNTTLVTGDPAATVRDLKARPGEPLAIFGSGRLTAALLCAGLVDELRVVVAPILLGRGRQFLADLDGRVGLELARTTTFRSGNVLLCYRPAPA